MKIVLATGIYPPEIGGPATYVKALAEELTKLGCQIKIVTYSTSNKTDSFSAVPVYKIKKQQNFFSCYLKYFLQILKLCSWADLVCIFDLMSAGLPASLAAGLKSKPVVFRTGGDFLWEKAFQMGWTKLPLTKYYQAGKNLREKFLLSFGRFILKKINLIIFSTKLQLEIYTDYYKVARQKTALIENAIPQFSLPAVDSRYSNSIVFAGRLIKLKNLERLIKVFKEINSKETELLIFGEGPEEKCLGLRISSSALRATEDKKDLGLTGKVKLMGKVSHEELLKIINSCKFVIIPSVSEISPNTVLECLSINKPVIVTQETGLDSGIISYFKTINPLSEDDIKEKMEYLLNPDNLNSYTNSLKSINIKKREWQDVATDHFNIFKKLLEK